MQRPESHLTSYASFSLPVPIPVSLFNFVPVPSLQQASLYAEPVQSLPDVPDQLSHAALLTQWLHDRVQLLEEIYRRVKGETPL